MVISQIIGGLGNQMFQYAAGRALSLRNNTELVLDISGFDNYELHQGFELQDVFSHSFEIASSSDVHKLLGWQSSARIRQVISRKPFSFLCRKRFVLEPYFHYWSGINDVGEDCYLSGYWQSEKYFSDVAQKIRTDFTFNLPLQEKNTVLASQMEKVNSVSLHIRRGDYANNPKTIAVHGLCSLDYYRKAIRYIGIEVEQPQFFIFSDDIAWVKDNLEIDFPHTHVQHNYGKDSYNDMRLMSLCRHNIIANSSFSWWGAWLNSYPEKIVIAPRKWFANKNDISDLTPSDWVTL